MTSNRPSYRDGVQMLRLVHLLQHSVNREMHADRLASKLGVSRRTVLRYAEALDADRVGVGTPSLTRERREDGSWIRLDDQERPIESRVFQYAATYAGSRIFTAGGGSLLADTSQRVLERMQVDLGTRRPDLIARVRTAFVHVPFGPKRYRHEDDTLDTLLQALLACHPVRATYRGADGAHGERTFEPFTVVLYRDGLYILARIASEQDEGRWRLLAVDRLGDLSIIKDRTFEVPEDFEPAFLFEGSAVGLWPSNELPQALRLAFAPAVAVYVRERQWPDARWNERADGWSVLGMRVVVTPEIIAWILSWGADVEVLAPEQVRRQIAERATRVADLYAGTDPGDVRSAGKQLGTGGE